MISTTIPAVVSVGLNLLLLPKLGYIGAAIVSVLTEALVWAIQLYFTRNYLKEVPLLASTVKIIGASALMYSVLFVVKTTVNITPVINVMVFAAIGAVLYIFQILFLKVISPKELKQQLLNK